MEMFYIYNQIIKMIKDSHFLVEDIKSKASFV